MRFINLTFGAMPTLAVVGSLFLAPTLGAVSLVPGATLAGPGDAITIGTLFSAADPDLSYAVQFKNALGQVTGTGTLWVGVYNDATVGLGGLDFVYQYTLATGDLANLAASGFAGWPTDVGAATNAPSANFVLAGSPTTTLNRSGGTGSTVNFEYSPTVVAPQNTQVLVVNVKNAYAVALVGSVGMTDDTQAGPFLAYAPTPEPAFGGLLLSGLLGVGLLVRRRFLARQS
jgi:hypothetical protein